MIGLTIAALLAASPTDVIRHYVRSNRDGSEAENIVHFRPSRTAVAVYKWVSKCHGAAYVTARMRPGRWEPAGLDAGKVAKDGTQAKFGRLDHDLRTGRVSAVVELPSGKLSDAAVLPTDRPWFLFDYDLGDLNSHLQETRPARTFSFNLALVWPGDAKFLTHMATVQARHRGLENRDGHTVRRFDLNLTGAKGGQGRLWLDPESGAIVEAEASQPNHPGMKDFRLKLQRTELGGLAAWQRLLRAHYGDCPA